MPTIRLEAVSKYYKSEGRKKYPAVSDISLTITQGEFVFIVGSSGAGKSTILRLMTGDIKPSSGNVYLDDWNLAKVPPWAGPSVRLSFGQVLQQPQLVRRNTIGENLTDAVKASLFFRRDELKEKVTKALGIVGMPGVEDKYPGELSIGEIRRVDLARAFINSPPILILDELIISQADDTGWDLMQLLREINRQGTTVVMATHAGSLVNIMRRRVITLVDGKIVGDIKRGKYGEIPNMPRRILK